MKVWHLLDARNCKLLTNRLEVNSSTNEVVISNDPDSFVAELPKEDFIKVKLAKASVTSADISSFVGNYNTFPIVPIRSCLAQVSESSIESFKTGQRLFLSPYQVNNNGKFKTRGVDIDGYLGDYAYVPIRDIYSIPDGIADQDVVFIEDIALAINALEELSPEKGQYLAIHGASYINIIIAQLAIYYQTIPVIIDDDEDRLTVAQNCGVYYTLNTKEEIASSKLNEITSGKMCDYLVFDADTFTALDDLINFVHPDGKVCIVGYNKYIQPIRLDVAKFVAKALRLIGINNGCGAIPTAINMLANGIIKTRGLIGEQDTLESYNELMKKLSSMTNYYKSIIDC